MICFSQKYFSFYWKGKDDSLVSLVITSTVSVRSGQVHGVVTCPTGQADFKDNVEPWSVVTFTFH